MKKLIVAFAAFFALATAPALAEEQEPARKLQIAPYVGGLFPTGDQRRLLDNAFLYGVALSYDVHPYVAVVGSFAFAEPQAQGFEDNDLSLFQYDLGIQGQYAFDIASGIALKPFVGCGVGARTYDLQNVDAETDFAGYFAAGGKVEYRDASLGLTVRDYVSDFDGIGRREDSSFRNDIAVFLSLGARF